MLIEIVSGHILLTCILAAILVSMGMPFWYAMGTGFVVTVTAWTLFCKSMMG